MQVKDNVRCNNCGWKGLVKVGEETCPICNFKGGLTWKNEDRKEVRI